MTELTLTDILTTGAKCSNLTKKIKKEIDDAVNQKGLVAKNLPLGAKLFILRNNLTEIPKCKSCNKELAFHNPSCSYRTYCSYTCSANSKDTIKKRQQTNIVKYGSTNVLTSKKVVKNTEKKMLEKHGVKCYMHSEEFKQRYLNGDIVYKKDPELHRHKMFWWSYNNVLTAFKDKVVPLFPFEEFQGGGPGKYYKWLCIRCNNEFENYYNRQKGTWPKCPHCDSAHTDIEYFIINLLKKYNIPCKLRDRQTIKERELDIYIPQLNLAIETNGLYFHSEKKIEDHLYHIKKTKLCEEKNIRLIQIFADEIYHKKNLCTSKLKNILGINKELDSNLLDIKVITDCHLFLNKYTFFGEEVSEIKLGAFYKNKLVAVMTFIRDHVVQFATINSFNVDKSFSKFVKFYSEYFNIKNVFYKADIRWQPSNYLEGGKFIQTESPKCWYTKDYLRRINYYKEGFVRIWDCGYNLFIF